MKILMLGWELPPHNSGGLGVACYQLCKALSKKPIDIEFVLPYKADHGIEFMTVTAAHPQGVIDILKSGIAYDSYSYTYSDGHTEEHNIFDQQSMYEFAVGRIVRERRFDIVHAHDWLTFRAAIRAKEFLGCPVILHVHSIESDRAGGKRGNPMVHDIEEFSFYAADRIIAVSEFTKRAIHRDYGVPLDKIDVVHNSLDKDYLVPMDYQLVNTFQYPASMRAQGYRVVTNVGRLTIQKGLPNLLRAAQIVVQKNPKTLFLIAGTGEQYIELIELSAQLGIAKNVIFTGFLRGKDWRDAFATSDLFVMPSISEPFGITPLEAVGYGTPSLISKQSGVSEVLHSALKVDFWDVNEMANQILAVINNDPLRDELLKNASEEVDRMSWNNAADKLFGIYQSQLQGAVV